MVWNVFLHFIRENTRVNLHKSELARLTHLVKLWGNYQQMILPDIRKCSKSDKIMGFYLFTLYLCARFGFLLIWNISLLFLPGVALWHFDLTVLASKFYLFCFNLFWSLSSNLFKLVCLIFPRLVFLLIWNMLSFTFSFFALQLVLAKPQKTNSASVHFLLFVSEVSAQHCHRYYYYPIKLSGQLNPPPLLKPSLNAFPILFCAKHLTKLA